MIAPGAAPGPATAAARTPVPGSHTSHGRNAMSLETRLAVDEFETLAKGIILRAIHSARLLDTSFFTP